MEATAGDLAALFSSAGEALYGFIADPASIDMCEEMSVSACGEGPEELLHAWLCELLAQFNLTGFVGKRCTVAHLTDRKVDGTIRGEKLDL